MYLEAVELVPSGVTDVVCVCVDVIVSEGSADCVGGSLGGMVSVVTSCVETDSVVGCCVEVTEWSAVIEIVGDSFLVGTVMSVWVSADVGCVCEVSLSAVCSGGICMSFVVESDVSSVLISVSVSV